MKDGWGLATDGKVLFGSDGSSTLYQIDPQTFKAVSKQVVFYKGHQVHNLNELEYINGEVWANVFTTDCIAKISPNDGVVVGWILLPNLREELIKAGYTGIDVLNGIAWDAEQERIFAWDI
jgi:glutamine cyclotransferase